MKRNPGLIMVGLGVLLVIAVGGGTVLLHLAALSFVWLLVAGTAIAMIRPARGWRIIGLGLVALFVVGLFGPAVVGWLHMVFGR